MKRVTAIIFLLLIISGCRKKMHLQWQPEWAFPLFNAQLTMEQINSDLLNNSLTYDSSQTFYFQYDDTLLHFKLDTLTFLNDTTLIDTSYFVPGPMAPGITFIDESNRVVLKIDPVKLKKVAVKKGIVSVELTNTLPEKIDFSIKIPSAVYNTDTFEVQEQVPANSTIVQEYDLSNYTFNLKDISTEQYNTFVIQYKATSDSSGNIIPSGFYTVKAKVDMKDFQFHYAEGYFGKQTIHIEENTSINLLPNITSGTMLFQQASAQITMKNHLGLEFAHQPADITFFNQNQSIDFQDDEQQMNTIFNRATQINNEVIPVDKTFSFTEQNSNIETLLGFFPQEVYFSSDITVNPLGNISNYNDFIYDDKGLLIMANITIPFIFQSNNLSFCDTLAINPQIDSIFLQAQYSGTVDLITTNTLNTELQLNVYFLNNQEEVIDSLFHNLQKIPYSTSANLMKNVAEISNEKLQNIGQSRAAKIIVTIDNTDYVTIKNTDKITVKPILHIVYDAEI